MPRVSSRPHDRSPLIQHEENDHDEGELIEFSEDDEGHPRNWPARKKLTNIAVIAAMAILSPLASSMFTPGIKQIAKALDATETGVIGCQTGFVITLGIGPLILAPISETFGRKPVYLICFSIFTLLQIPTALSPSLPVLITFRTLAGFFGSVSIANGGGTISDMYEPSERAGIFGWYLLGPLLGPSIGPLIGGVILQHLNWPWLFWIFLIICAVVMVAAFLLLQETYVPRLLADRKTELERSEGGKYHHDGEDNRGFNVKLSESIRRPLQILFTQPIVLTMAAYQALLFATVYSLYTQFPSIYGEGPDGYGFSTMQTGFLYLVPGLGFLTAVQFIVPKIDTVYNSLARKHHCEPKPEFRLPLANIGAVLIPISTFWFAWSVEYHLHWALTIASLYFFGLGMVSIFNSVQNYYIDSFEKYAASAIAAGAFFRSLVGGVIPLFTPGMLDAIGVGWGISVFGFIGLALMPAPALFYYYGGWLRERFAVDL